MSIKTYIVTADNVSAGAMTDLVGHLRAAGLEITQRLDAAGVIVGSADEAAIEQIRRLPGVAAVEEEQSFQLPSSEDLP